MKKEERREENGSSKGCWEKRAWQGAQDKRKKSKGTSYVGRRHERSK